MTRVLLPLIALLEVLTAHKNHLLGEALLLPRNVVLLSAPVKILSRPPWCLSPRVTPQWFPHLWHALEPVDFVWNVSVLSFNVMFWRPFMVLFIWGARRQCFNNVNAYCVKNLLYKCAVSVITIHRRYTWLGYFGNVIVTRKSRNA